MKENTDTTRLWSELKASGGFFFSLLLRNPFPFISKQVATKMGEGRGEEKALITHLINDRVARESHIYENCYRLRSRVSDSGDVDVMCF